MVKKFDALNMDYFFFLIGTALVKRQCTFIGKTIKN